MWNHHPGPLESGAYVRSSWNHDFASASVTLQSATGLIRAENNALAFFMIAYSIQIYWFLD
jgi:hypothetical protein